MEGVEQIIVKRMDLLAKIALLTATLIWGSSFIVMKKALDDIGTFYILAIRFTGAFLLLSVIFWKKLRLLNGKYLWHGFLMGSMLFAAYAVQTFGLLYTTPGKNAFLTANYCILVPFLFWMVAKVKPDLYNVIAAVFCVIGIGLVSLGEDLSIGLGDSLSAACGLFYALHIIISACFTQHEDVTLLTLLQFLFAGLWGLILGGCFEPFPQAIPLQGWISIGYLCIFATAVALLCQTFGLKYTAPSAASLILSLEAVFGVLFSVLLGAEMLTGRLVVGFVIIFMGIMISETKLEFLWKKLNI